VLFCSAAPLLLLLCPSLRARHRDLHHRDRNPPRATSGRSFPSRERTTHNGKTALHSPSPSPSLAGTTLAGLRPLDSPAAAAPSSAVARLPFTLYNTRPYQPETRLVTARKGATGTLGLPRAVSYDASRPFSDSSSCLFEQGTSKQRPDHLLYGQRRLPRRPASPRPSPVILSSRPLTSGTCYPLPRPPLVVAFLRPSILARHSSSSHPITTTYRSRVPTPLTAA